MADDSKYRVVSIPGEDGFFPQYRTKKLFGRGWKWNYFQGYFGRSRMPTMSAAVDWLKNNPYLKPKAERAPKVVFQTDAFLGE